MALRVLPAEIGELGWRMRSSAMMRAAAAATCWVVRVAPSMASVSAQSLLAGSRRMPTLSATNPSPGVIAVALLAKPVVAVRSRLATRRSRAQLMMAVWQTSFAQRCVVLVAVVVACGVETWNV